MNQKETREKIRKELEKLDRKQMVHFAWRCAVYTLPILGSRGNFNFWRKEVRQTYMYAIFSALDFNAIISVTEAYAVANASNSASTAANAARAAFAARATFAAYTARAAATAAYAGDAPDTTYATYAANSAANVARAAFAAAAAAKININFETIILNDIKAMQQGKKIDQQISTDLYGEVWDNFQKALEKEGCAYWGRLYMSIMDTGFILDPDALVRRINVPKEIRAQGASAVANYLEELEKGAKRLNEARIIILGDKGAGKTCIARRLINPSAQMTTKEESTAGVDTTLWKLKKENINVRIWDFAGHTVTHAVHQFFLSERCLYIIVYDGRTEERNRLEYWLNHMKNYGGNSEAIILVNKQDQHSVDIPINNLKEQFNVIRDYTFSIKDDKQELETFRNDVIEYINNNPSWNKQEIPKNYFQVKEKLEELFTECEKKHGKEHISKKEFKEIAVKSGVSTTEKLLEALHFLGVCLWYKKMEDFDTLILNPEWLSHGVYKIINWVNENKKYALSLEDCIAVFENDACRFPFQKHKFLFKLMKHYELAYETKRGDQLIIPHLLKEDRPAKLPDFLVGESLMLRYKAEQPLPPHTISRFIVRHNMDIKKEKQEYLVWRYGVVLDDGNGNVALVREEDRTISVLVKGQDKTNYISTLRETLNDIFASYKSEKPELQYRIEPPEQNAAEFDMKKDIWLPDKKIINHVVDNEPYYEDNTRQRIDLHYTVNVFNISGDNTTIGGHANTYSLDQSKNVLNFNNCNIDLQGNLNALAQLLSETGNEDEAEQLTNAANMLEQAEQCKSKEEVKKKGIVSRLKRLVDDLSNEESRLHQAVEGVKHGIGIVQDIAKGYNDIAQWVGWPQVPKPFLKKGE